MAPRFLTILTRPQPAKNPAAARARAVDRQRKDDCGLYARGRADRNSGARDHTRKTVAMTWNRAIAILITIAVTAILNQVAGLNGYASSALGIVGYFVTRYVLWAIADQRRLKGELDQFVKDYRDKTPSP
jgi:Flp pilus assembly protein TadB